MSTSSIEKRLDELLQDESPNYERMKAVIAEMYSLDSGWDRLREYTHQKSDLSGENSNKLFKLAEEFETDLNNVPAAIAIIKGLIPIYTICVHCHFESINILFDKLANLYMLLGDEDNALVCYQEFIGELNHGRKVALKIGREFLIKDWQIQKNGPGFTVHVDDKISIHYYSMDFGHGIGVSGGELGLGVEQMIVDSAILTILNNYISKSLVY